MAPASPTNHIQQSMAGRLCLVKAQHCHFSSPDNSRDHEANEGSACAVHDGSSGGGGRTAAVLRLRPSHVRSHLRGGSSRAAFKCSSHSELHRPQATATALATSAETFRGHAATSYGLEGW